MNATSDNPVTEKAVKDALKKYLKSIGAYYFMPVQMGYGSAGLDFFVCHKGQFYGIETKRPSKSEPTVRQHFIMDEIARAGGGVWLENSPGLEMTRSMILHKNNTAKLVDNLLNDLQR